MYSQDDKEKKRLEQLQRKQELAKLHDEEQESLKSGKPKTAGSAKITRHQIDQHRETLTAAEGCCQKVLLLSLLLIRWLL